MISHFVKIMDDLKLFHQKTQQNQIRRFDLLGAIPQIRFKKYKKNQGTSLKNMDLGYLNFLEFQNFSICWTY